VCGIVALLVKDPTLEASLGSMLVPMIESLSERGPDSWGIGLYSTPERDRVQARSDVSRVSLGSEQPLSWPAVCSDVSEAFGPPTSATAFPGGALVETGAVDEADLRRFLDGSWPQAHILATGRRVVVAKGTGDPREAGPALGLSSWAGYLAVAHTRMATESAVTPLHSHPFVPDRDLCVVHNGSFSNHASVRRVLERRGISFDSDNDSEVAARLLAERLRLGDDLEEATRWVMKELDGFFTLVITTADAMSVVRDAFACKPAVVAETERYVAVASEYRALAHLPDIATAEVFEPRPEEVYTWTR
jgi:methylamine---glutamate N-methyltransferase subunit A